MHFTSLAIVSSLAGAISALAIENASPVVNVVAQARSNSPYYTAPPECSPGQYQCTDADWGNGQSCQSCAISVGNGGANCELNNFCGANSGSCQTYPNGQPYCT